MAVQSTTTLIQAVNRVLESIGERRVTSLNSPIATLTKNVIQDTVYELSNVHDWSWARENIPATSWVTKTAQLTNVTKIWGVLTGDTLVGFRNATFLERNVFDQQSLIGYTATSFPLGEPRFFTISGYRTVDVNPYPADSTSQARVFFDVTRLLVPPTVPTQTFPIPEEFMPLVYYKAGAVLSVVHLVDTQTAAQMQSQFEIYAQRARQTDGLHPAKGHTMHRRGRGRY
jgi:hypothetical protein